MRRSSPAFCFALLAFPLMWTRRDIQPKATPQTHFDSATVVESSWLHPSDREYQYAIDSTFGQSNEGAGDRAEALEFIRRLTEHTNSYLSIRPPLACASLQAEVLKRQLVAAPSVDEVKKACDGQLLVGVRYFSAPLVLDRSLIIRHGDHQIKPVRSFYDQAHAVVAIDDSSGSKVIQYAYLDLHVLVPDAAWDDDVMFVTADGNGGQSVLTFNFSTQVENERHIDSASTTWVAENP